MRKTHRPLAAAALAVAALAPAAVAQAATKDVSLGYNGAPPKGMPDAAALYDFFPRTIKIHKGDKVNYTTYGFGVVYSGPKSKIQPVAVIDDSTKATGFTGPDNQPFWFDGQVGTPMANPLYLSNAGDGKVHKGQKDVDHGAIPEDKPVAYTLQFAKPGAYTVYDALHPKVTSKVIVVPKKSKVPSQAADDKRAAKQAAKLAKEAKKLANPNVPPQTIKVGNDSKRVGFFEFFPGDQTVKAGQPVTITTGAYANDVHDLVIGPASYTGPLANNLFQPGPAGLILDARGVFPSQAPTAPLTFDGSQNGGFLSTGAFDADPKSPIPNKTTVTFTKPGVYHYVCLFHSDGVYAPGAQNMQGTITVQ